MPSHPLVLGVGRRVPVLQKWDCQAKVVEHMDPWDLFFNSGHINHGPRWVPPINMEPVRGVLDDNYPFKAINVETARGGKPFSC